MSVDRYRAAFPQMKGFSPRNLGYMKTFANTYPFAHIPSYSLVCASTRNSVFLKSDVLPHGNNTSAGEPGLIAYDRYHLF